MSNKYLTTFPAAVKQADLDILRPEGMRLPMPDVQLSFLIFFPSTFILIPTYYIQQQFPESDEITPKKFTKSTKPLVEILEVNTLSHLSAYSFDYSGKRRLTLIATMIVLRTWK